MPRSQNTALSPAETFALLFGLVLLALAVVFLIGGLGPLDGDKIACPSATTPAASAQPTTAASPGDSAPATATGTTTPVTDASTPNAGTGEACLYGFTFTAQGASAFFLIVLLVLLFVYKQLRQASLKMLGRFTSFGPYAQR